MVSRRRQAVRICYLGNSASIHTVRWAKYFSDHGDDVIVISFQFGKIEGVNLICLSSASTLSRWHIIRFIPKVRSLVKDIKPDILHAHYATSYGLAGALANKHPLVVTAWGSDVLIMPEKSLLYRHLVRFVMKRADLVTSMAEHMTQHLILRNYVTPAKLITLPFGVDTGIFNLNQRTRWHGEGDPIVISTRRLDYGLDVDIFVKAI